MQVGGQTEHARWMKIKLTWNMRSFDAQAPGVVLPEKYDRGVRRLRWTLNLKKYRF